MQNAGHDDHYLWRKGQKDMHLFGYRHLLKVHKDSSCDQGRMGNFIMYLFRYMYLPTPTPGIKLGATCMLGKTSATKLHSFAAGSH